MAAVSVLFARSTPAAVTAGQDGCYSDQAKQSAAAKRAAFRAWAGA